MEKTQIAEALFDALARRDDQAVRSLCSKDLRVRQNMGRAMDLETHLLFNHAVGRAVKDFRYSDAVRSATASGFVEEHAVNCTLPDGSTLNFPVCVVAILDGDKVAKVREYFDSAAVAGLVAALQ